MATRVRNRLWCVGRRGGLSGSQLPYSSFNCERGASGRRRRRRHLRLLCFYERTLEAIKARIMLFATTTTSVLHVLRMFRGFANRIAAAQKTHCIHIVMGISNVRQVHNEIGRRWILELGLAGHHHHRLPVRQIQSRVLVFTRSRSRSLVRFFRPREIYVLRGSIQQVIIIIQSVVHIQLIIHSRPSSSSSSLSQGFFPEESLYSR